MSDKSEQPRFCTVPELPEREFSPSVSVQRARLVRVISKKWLNGTVLHYYFFDGDRLGASDEQKDIVRQAFDVWKDIGLGIKFKEVSSPDDAEIRIGFLQGDGAWSYVGTDILKPGQNERTMNFGWNLAGRDGLDTAVHEIGHTLGFPHEHQNPNAGMVWDEEAVYDALGGPPNNWSKQTTYWNIIRKIPPDTVEGSKWDPNSIMHYPFGPGLIKEPEEYKDGIRPEPGLSNKDIKQTRFFYPQLEQEVPELKVLESERISINPGEQKNFKVVPTASRYYNFRTFGDSDTVMVLFEDGDEPKYVKGDDDSGTDYNASFRIRLIKGRKYILKIRLFYQSSSGNTGVMMW